MKLIDYLVRTLPGIGGWKDRDINVVIDNTSIVINIKGDEAAGLIDGCSMVSITRAQYEAALAASQKVEWDGDGLPPVGCECEARYRHAMNAAWGYFRCVAVDCEVAFGWIGKEPVTLLKDNFEFRPIRSEADKKRETAVEAMTGLWNANTKMHCEAIYDAIKSGQIVIE